MAGKRVIRRQPKESPKETHLKETHPEETHTRPMCWEGKRQRDPFLIWDGSYRWFRSENVVPLERYRTAKEIDRIRINVLLRRPSGPRPAPPKKSDNARRARPGFLRMIFLVVLAAG